MKKSNFLLNVLPIILAAMLSINLTSCREDDRVSTGNPSVSFSGNGGSQSVSISSNTSWTISGMPGWLSVSPTQGTKDGNIIIVANENTSSTSRNCTLSIVAGTASTSIFVTQDPGSVNPPSSNQVIVTNNSTYVLYRFRIVFLNSRNETLSDIDCGTLSPGKSASADIPTAAKEYYMATLLSSTWFFSPNYDIQYKVLSLSTDEIGRWKSNSSSPSMFSENITE